MGMLIDNTHADNVHSFIRAAKAKAPCSSTDGKTRGRRRWPDHFR